jgi:hypothetical protein
MTLPNKQVRRISKRQLEELCLRVSEQDKRMMTDIRTCHYLTSRQIMRLYFRPVAHIKLSASVRNTTRHLFRLKDWGLVDHLERRIGGVRAGSGANIWHLTSAGYKLLYLNRQADDAARLIRRYHEPTQGFLTHRLAVAELFTCLRELTDRRRPPDLIAAQLEPNCWRKHPSPFGGKASTLKPDAYAITAIDEYEDHWFFEVDLSTESPAVVIRKCEQYLLYYQAGVEQREQGVFPRVIWIVPTDKRKESLVRHMVDRFTELQREVFVIITLDELHDLIHGRGEFSTETTENPAKVDPKSLEIRGKERYD